jgi:hypothetical protein
MTAPEMLNLHRFLRVGALLATLFASACGGGGGGKAPAGNPGAGNNPPPPITAYSLSTTTVTQTRSVLDVNPVFSDIAVTIPNAAEVPFGIGGRFSNSGIASVGYDRSIPKLTIYFKVPAGLAPGAYSDSVTIGVCEDANCTTQRAGTTRTITAAYTVTAATLPSFTVATSTFNVSALAGDTAPTAPIIVPLTVINPAPFTPSGYTTVSTTSGVFLVAYTASSATNMSFIVTMKSPTTLAPGTYTDTVTLRMCLYFDNGCQNELAISPATITVNYTITDTVSGPAGYTTRLSAARANDAAWDATRGVLYLSVPSDAPERAATITEFNPVTGAFGASVAAGTEPNLLAISDNDQYLYVADKAQGEIRRFTLGPLAPDITIPLGNDTQHPSAYPHVAWDLAVAPAQPRVIAVQRQILQFSPGNRGAVVFDDAVARPAIWDSGNYLQWGADATRLYSSGQIASVDAGGAATLANYPGVSGHIALVGGRMFGDFGQVTEVATATSLGPIVLDGAYQNIAADRTLGRVYLLTHAPTNYGITQIESYDAATLTRIGIGRLPVFAIPSNNPARATRFGADGLAIVTDSHHVVLVKGPLIAP